VEQESFNIQQVIDGDVTRFAYLVTKYKGLAFSIAMRILENEQDAEEAVQDSFIQAFRSIKTFKGNARFSTWLYRIVVNHSLNRLKKRKTVRQYDQIELAEEHFVQVECGYRRLTSQDQAKYINLALEKLAPEDRIILTLYYLEVQPLSEISVITGISKENIKMKLHRARGKMYSILTTADKRAKRRMILSALLRFFALALLLIALAQTFLPAGSGKNFVAAAERLTENPGQKISWLWDNVYFIFPLIALFVFSRIYGLRTA
jgi:RNA polymerase sigma factor (sigma-70 family)